MAKGRLGVKIKSWDQNFEEFKRFVLKYDRIPIQKEMIWPANQKTFYKSGKLAKDKIKLIETVVPDFFEVKTQKPWNENFQEFKKFVLYNLRTPTQKEMPWTMNQKAAFRDRKLSKNKIELIESIVPDFFENKFKTWEENYFFVLSFLNENERLPNTKENWWLYQQKVNYRKGYLTPDQIQLIKNLDSNIFNKFHGRQTNLRKIETGN